MRAIKNVRSFGKTNEEEKPFVGPKTLPPTPEEKLIKLDKILETNENKTAKVLEKQRVIREKSESDQRVTTEKPQGIQTVTNERSPSNQAVISETSEGNHSRRPVSYDTFVCIPKKLATRKILELIKGNAFEKEGKWFCILDSDEAMKVIGKDFRYLKTIIARLKEQGWFEVEEAFAGYRRLTIDPKVYGITK